VYRVVEPTLGRGFWGYVAMLPVYRPQMDGAGCATAANNQDSSWLGSSDGTGAFVNAVNIGYPRFLGNQVLTGLRTSRKPLLQPTLRHV
jgi:hypothetical protein